MAVKKWFTETSLTHKKEKEKWKNLNNNKKNGNLVFNFLPLDSFDSISTIKVLRNFKFLCDNNTLHERAAMLPFFSFLKKLATSASDT